MSFYCKHCEYKTKDTSNYNRHIKSKKHLKKEYASVLIAPQNSPKLPKTPQKSKFICDFCNCDFSRNSNLTRHMKVCVTRGIELKKNTEEHEMEKLKMELDKYKEQSEKYKAETEYYRKLLDSYSSFAPRTINSLTYIMNNYDKAPHIKALDVDNIEVFSKDDIIYNYRHKKLYRFLGDLVLSVYKKDDPSKQSIWTTDTSRLTYIIRELMEKNYTNWIIDKKGTRVKEYIIDPLMRNITKLLLTYQHNKTVDFKKYAQKHNIDLLDNYKTISDIFEEIEHKTLSEKILKYIAGKLYHNSKTLLDN